MMNTTNTQPSANTNVQAEVHQEAKFFAQPYNIDGTGFYFSSFDEYEEKSKNAKDSFGLPLEEFEIQFIDGSDEESDLFEAAKVNQATLEEFIEMLDTRQDYELPALFYLMDVCGYSLDAAQDKIDDVCLYHGELKDAATELFDECYLANVPEAVKPYIDYDAFARDCDLNGDMNEFTFGGTTYTVTNANGL